MMKETIGEVCSWFLEELFQVGLGFTGGMVIATPMLLNWWS
jgi:hypothetical protein